MAERGEWLRELKRLDAQIAHLRSERERIERAVARLKATIVALPHGTHARPEHTRVDGAAVTVPTPAPPGEGATPAATPVLTLSGASAPSADSSSSAAWLGAAGDQLQSVQSAGAHVPPANVPPGVVLLDGYVIAAAIRSVRGEPSLPAVADDAVPPSPAVDTNPLTVASGPDQPAAGERPLPVDTQENPR